MRIIFLLLLFIPCFTPAQQVVKSVLLNDVIVNGVKKDFDVDEFIRYVKEDTTFYMAFKYLRYYSHQYESELVIFNKKSEKIGEVRRKGTHFSNGRRAWVVDSEKESKGEIVDKKGEYQYYTAEAFDEVFFPYDTISVSLKISDEKNKNESQNMRDAKTVGFSIGSEDTEQRKGSLAKKLAVFDKEMQPYYIYKIDTCTYHKKSCYNFTVEVKNKLSKKELEKTLIRKIVSYFDRENFNVIYREYTFSYNSWLIDLDMHMVVHTNYFKDKPIPTAIYYSGFWDVPLFKPERSTFKLNLSSYKVY